MVLTLEEALLRVALMVARADGHTRPDEAATAIQALPILFRELSDRRLEELLEGAQADLDGQDEDSVMARVLEALPDHAAKVNALKVACLVAGADQMLAWSEASYLSRLAQQLGLSKRDVGQVVRAAR